MKRLGVFWILLWVIINSNIFAQVPYIDITEEDERIYIFTEAQMDTVLDTYLKYDICKRDLKILYSITNKQDSLIVVLQTELELKDKKIIVLTPKWFDKAWIGFSGGISLMLLLVLGVK